MIDTTIISSTSVTPSPSSVLVVITGTGALPLRRSTWSDQITELHDRISSAAWQSDRPGHSAARHRGFAAFNDTMTLTGEPRLLPASFPAPSE
jgi:hypothetical protein